MKRINDELLGVIFQLQSGDAARLVGYDPQARVVTMRPVVANRSGGKAQRIPVALFMQAYHTGAIVALDRAR